MTELAELAIMYNVPEPTFDSSDGSGDEVALGPTSPEEDDQERWQSQKNVPNPYRGPRTGGSERFKEMHSSRRYMYAQRTLQIPAHAVHDVLQRQFEGLLLLTDYRTCLPHLLLHQCSQE